MTRIFFACHGEPEPDDHARGNLSARGKAQVDALARRLGPERFVAAYTSPFPYARQTAEIIAAPRGLTVQPHVLVRDVDFGMLSAFLAEFAATDAAALARWWAEQEPGMRFPGGESLGALRRRVRRFMNQMADRHRDADVLVATHDSTMRMAASLARDMGDEHHFDPDIVAAPGSLTVVHITLGQAVADGGVQLSVHGDASHLGSQAPGQQQL